MYVVQPETKTLSSVAYAPRKEVRIANVVGHLRRLRICHLVRRAASGGGGGIGHLKDGCGRLSYHE